MNFVTFVTPDLFDFARNWAYWLRRIQVSDRHVGVMDDHTDIFRSGRVIDPSNETRVFRAGLVAHKQSGRWRCVLTFLRDHSDRHTVVSDVDVAWQRNPIVFFAGLFARASALDVAISTDAVRATKTLRGLEPSNMCQESMNIGLLALRANSSGVARALTEAVDELEQMENRAKVDQGLINARWKFGGRNRRWSTTLVTSPTKKVCRAVNGTVGIGVLPVRRFCNSATVLLGVCRRPFATHMTWLRAQDLSSKRLRLRELGLWATPSPRTAERRLLRYDHGVSTRMLSRALHQPAMRDGVPRGHLRLLAHHARRLFKMLLLARRLNATVVVPRLPCACEIGQWRGHVGGDCRAHKKTRLPFTCPLEHLLRPPALEASNASFAFAREARGLPSTWIANVDDNVSDTAIDAERDAFNALLSSWCCSANRTYDAWGGHVPLRTIA